MGRLFHLAQVRLRPLQAVAGVLEFAYCPHSRLQLSLVDRLADEIIRPRLDRPLDVPHLIERRDHDDRDVRRLRVRF